MQWSRQTDLLYVILYFLLQDTITSGVRKLLNSLSPALQSFSFFLSLFGVEKIDSFVRNERDGNQKRGLRDSKGEVVGPGREIILLSSVSILLLAGSSRQRVDEQRRATTIDSDSR